MQQKVDPFIPLNKKHHPPAGPYGAQYFKNAPPKPSLTAPKTVVPNDSPVLASSAQAAPKLIVDITDQSTPKPHIEQPRITKSVESLLQSTTQPIPKHSRQAKTKHLLKRKLRISILVMLTVVGVGLLLQSLLAGEVIIAFYAVFAFIKHIPSRVSFVLALIALVFVVLLNTFQNGSALTNNFAVYAFLLLMVGTLFMGLEIRKSSTT